MKKGVQGNDSKVVRCLMPLLSSQEHNNGIQRHSRVCRVLTRVTARRSGTSRDIKICKSSSSGRLIMLGSVLPRSRVGDSGFSMVEIRVAADACSSNTRSQVRSDCFCLMRDGALEG